MANSPVKKSSKNTVSPPNSPQWGSVSKFLHWFSALYLVGLAGVGIYISNFAAPPLKFELINMHKAFGAIFLVLVTFRLLWRWTHPIPPIPDNPVYRLSLLSAPILYLFMFIMPLSGFIMTQTAGYPISIFGLFQLPTLFDKAPEVSRVFLGIHQWSAFILIGLIVIHTLAAFYHHFVFKDDVLRRMWISKKGS